MYNKRLSFCFSKTSTFGLLNPGSRHTWSQKEPAMLGQLDCAQCDGKISDGHRMIDR